MATSFPYEIENIEGGVPVKRWTKGVPVEDMAKAQLRNVAKLPFVGPWVAAMPDMHVGKGATIGSVIPTEGAVIPAAVGVDLGCGMMAVQTSLTASDLPDNLAPLRSAIEAAVPHGRTGGGRGGRRDKGSWGNPPKQIGQAWLDLQTRYDRICDKHRAIKQARTVVHLGTLGTGNHFIEVCLDEAQQVWFMLHSGSRGVGNRIGTYFINLAREDMRKWMINLPDKDLAYLPEGTDHYDDYLEAVSWAQDFARTNRELMMKAVIEAAQQCRDLPPFSTDKLAVNCHHNYVSHEQHYGKDLLITRKGAVRAGKGELGIIPGSMGAKSFIVEGRGNEESFCSCSHGAGRVMSRTAAKKRFSVKDHERATKGIECRKDAAVIDETPMAYKPIEEVMKAQSDLVKIVHTLRQVVCVKG